MMEDMMMPKKKMPMAGKMPPEMMGEEAPAKPFPFQKKGKPAPKKGTKKDDKKKKEAPKGKKKAPPKKGKK